MPGFNNLTGIITVDYTRQIHAKIKIIRRSDTIDPSNTQLVAYSNHHWMTTQLRTNVTLMD